MRSVLAAFRGAHLCTLAALCAVAVAFAAGVASAAPASETAPAWTGYPPQNSEFYPGQKRQPWDDIEQLPVDNHQICRWFAGVDHPSVRHLCSHIVGAWNDRLPAPEGRCLGGMDCPEREAGRLRYLLVDFRPGRTDWRGGPFAGKQAEMQRIPAKALVGLLSADRLLPPHLTGGLVIYGARIDEPLVFEKTKVSTAITFAETVISGDVISRKFMGRDKQGQEDAWMGGPGEMAIVIENSVFDKELVIGKNSRVHGRIAAFNSRFSQFTVRKAQIEGEIEFWQIRADVVGLYGSVFDAGIYLVDNRLGGVQIRQTRFGNNVILTSNRIDGRLWIGRAAFNHKAKVISLSDNLVRGPMSMQTLWFGPAVETLNFKYNRLHGTSRIETPFLFQPVAENTKPSGNETSFWSGLPKDRAWFGRVDMSGSVVEAELRVRGARLKAEEGKEGGSAASDGADRPEGSAVQCSAADVADNGDSVFLDFTAAQIRIFNWVQTADCRFRWGGRGLRYELWNPDGLDPFGATSGGGGTQADMDRRRAAGLQQWRLALSGAVGDRVDPLSYLASYLDQQGYRTKGRDVLESAKRADYESRAQDSVQWTVLSKLLWLGGYGAKPERAAGLLLTIWLSGVVFYWGYSTWYLQRFGWARKDGKRWRILPRPSQWHMVPDRTDERDVSSRPGFLLIDTSLAPRHFTFWQYSADAMVPIISLQAFDRFYPAHRLVRGVALLQHALGTLLWAIFIATAAIL